MSLIPPRFLVRVAHPCRHVKKMPREDADTLLDLPESCRLDNFAALDGRTNFADVRLAWNELGLGFQAAVTGFDPEEHPRLGVYYAVRDSERGEQTLSVGSEFPYAEDPSLWQVLELQR